MKKIVKNKSAFSFKFQKGGLTQALQQGCWLLLDEINLASNETLERLHSILDSKSITLTEKAEINEIDRHPDFRFFGCMNPGS